MINKNITSEQKWLTAGKDMNTKKNTRTGTICKKCKVFTTYTINEENFGVLFEKYNKMTPQEVLYCLDVSYQTNDKYFGLTLLATVVYFDFDRKIIDDYTKLDYRAWSVTNTIGQNKKSEDLYVVSIRNKITYNVVRGFCELIMCK